LERLVGGAGAGADCAGVDLEEELEGGGVKIIERDVGIAIAVVAEINVGIEVAFVFVE
jgi:hypothetical protein